MRWRSGCWGPAIASRSSMATWSATTAFVANSIRESPCSRRSLRLLPLHGAVVALIGADDSRPVDAAVAAAGVARVGGMVRLTPGAGTDAADKQIDQLGLTGAVDKVVVVESTTSTSPPGPSSWSAVLFAALGVALLGLAAGRR